MALRIVLAVLAIGLGWVMSMPEQTPPPTAPPHSTTHPTPRPEESLGESDPHSEWEEVGEEVMYTESSDDALDDYEDVSDPPVLSDDMCPELLDVLNSMPENLTNTIEGLALDHPHGNGRCFKSRYSQCGSSEGVCDKMPFSVVYKRYKYCCPEFMRKHPLVERRRTESRIIVRCRCNY